MPSKRKPAHSRDRHARPGAPCPSTVDYLETQLLEWLETVPEPERRSGPGRLPVVPAVLLWTGLLVCLLRGFTSQLDVWRKLTTHGLWRFPRVQVSDMAIYQRLARTSPATLAQFLEHLSAALTTHLQGRTAVRGAAFAAEIYALDQTVLDPACAKLKIFRGLPKGDHRLLPGALGTVFDLRRQLWKRVVFNPQALANEKPAAPGLVAGLPAGSLLLFDLGYFSFPWLDQLVRDGFHFVCRVPRNVTWQEVHCFGVVQTARVRLRESLIYLGAGTAAHHSQGAFPLRRIEVTQRRRVGVDSPGDPTWCYVTDALDPHVFPAAEAVGLYGRRWDIETAFGVCKTHLQLHLVWSAQLNTVLHQVYATLILAQAISALRFEIADRAAADVREVSLELMLRWLPEFAAEGGGPEGQDPVTYFVQEGRRLGFIRPFRGHEREVPLPPETAYARPDPPPEPRRACYPRYAADSPQRALETALNAALTHHARPGQDRG